MIASCIIADDEPLAQELLKKYVKESGILDMKGACANAWEVSAMLREHPVDLLFLDIQMPKLSGIDLLRILKTPPAVIITTAHREYAIDGYAFDIIDYLLKPITFDRFIGAVEKFYRRQGRQSPVPAPAGQPVIPHFIYLKSGTKTHQLNEAGILYIESLKDFIQLNLENGEKILIKYQISKVEKELSPWFLRIHKSFIVNRNKITAFTATEIEIGSIKIPIGYSYKEEVTGKLNS
ncbi:MAG TPA: response regulator transcription factor [Niabella sp.]|nr:response regulator transcription factor [Niabella sp.]